MQRVVDGLEEPVALAFAPDGSDLYVAERRGHVKVVTGGGRIVPFATDLLGLDGEDPEPATGLRGLCVAPGEGTVFVTLVRGDGGGGRRNAVLRLRPQPDGSVARSQLPAGLGAHEAGFLHQIGPCRVSDGALLLAVGDGERPASSQDPRSPLGKVLRLALDGRPAPGNPFRSGEDDLSVGARVLALGLAHPTALVPLSDVVLVGQEAAGSGNVLELAAGARGAWDGSALSVGVGAALVLPGGLAPAAMDLVPRSHPRFPASARSRAYLAVSSLDPERENGVGVLALDVNPATGRLDGVPELFVEYRGSSTRPIADVAVGPDGLYLLVVSAADGMPGSLLRVAYRPSVEYPHRVGEVSRVNGPADAAAHDLMARRGCFACHDLHGARLVGPSLDPLRLPERLQRRLGSATYRRRVAELDARGGERLRRWKDARARVLSAAGRDRLRLWMRYHLLNPAFDLPDARMPDMRLSLEDIGVISDFLLGGRGEAPGSDGRDDGAQRP